MIMNTPKSPGILLTTFCAGVLCTSLIGAGGPAGSQKVAPHTKTNLQESELDQAWEYFRGDSKSSGVTTTELPSELEVLWLSLIHISEPTRPY